MHYKYKLSIYTIMKRPRGAITKDRAKAVVVYFPEEIMPMLDETVRALDTDRSKFIRRAVRELMESATIGGRYVNEK